MTDPSLSNSTTAPDRSVVAAQEAQPQTPSVAGSSTLDGHIATGETQPAGEPIAAPIATNFSTAGGTDNSKMAGVDDRAEADSTKVQSADQGFVHLQNNSDVPAERVQGLPDTDQMKLPIDTEVNLPD